jgi:diguanylate cyclase
MLQLWMRLTQVLQQDDRWARDLEKIAGGLNGDMAPAELADRIAKARDALQSEIRGLVNAVDLRTDLPTDMPNRVGLEEVLDMLLAMKRRFDRSFSLAVVAIDHFHQIHDSCGAIVTRPLLKVVARWIEDSVRDCDYVARCRNDAFAVVMPEATMQDAEVFCTMLRKMAGANHDLNVKLRISVGAVAPQPGETSDELLQRAEAAVQ